MKIKRLEISGFKSFADKVVIDFQQGVTGVVGPNGCGKSNIVDAIRWVMGEQSAKNLRGKAMEDVIFIGSETRKSLGMAEVSLIFSTEDGRAPAKYLDYAEVQLTRRLYRDGESDYLLNKTPCRLMDITELFMDTGVGTRAYSIIEQGKIGQILHARPEDRRFLIEEAAGVTKFKSRKQLALKKIEATRQNLSRLGDVMGEIKRQLSSLQRQAKKAEKFREYRDELREIELLLTTREYCELQEQRIKAENDLAMLNDRIRGVFSTSAACDAEVEKTRLRVLEAEKLLATAQEDIYRIKSEFSATENGLEFQRKELSGLESRLLKLDSESGQMQKRLTECAEQSNLLQFQRDRASGDVLDINSALEGAEQELVGHQQAEDELNRLLEGRRRDLFTAMSDLSQFKGRHENAMKRLANLAERMERHLREGTQLAERLEQTRSRASALNQEVAACEKKRDIVRSNLARLQSHEEDLRELLPVKEKCWQEQRDELQRSSSRLHSLQELEAQFAGYGQGVQFLMKSAEVNSAFSGLLADILDIPQDLEVAVEAVMADRLQCVLCDDTSSAVAALQLLKSGNGGRATLALPLEHKQPSTTAVSGATPLAGLIKVSGKFGDLVLRMLGDVMLVNTIEDAIKKAGKHTGLTFVTREGDMVALGGILSGGSSDPVQKGIIGKKRDIRKLEADVSLLELEADRLAAERDKLRTESEKLAEGLKMATERQHQAELKLAGIVKDRQQAHDEIISIEERLALQAMESATLKEEQDALEIETKLSLAGIEENVGVSEALEKEVARIKGELDTRREQLANVRERVIAIRVQSATLREQHDSHQRSLNDMERLEKELEQRIQGNLEETQQEKTEKTHLESAIASTTVQLQEQLQHQIAAESCLAELRSSCEEASSLLAASEARAKQMREESETVRQSQTELNLRFSTLNMQVEQLERVVLEKNRISMHDALEQLQKSGDLDARLARKPELQRLLDEMGEVNLMAIEECAGMEERFAFLTSQKDDLEDSLRSLQQAIQRINRTTRQRFLETYNLVNAKFQEVFPRLFCGGKAELRLTNEEDLLESGIDIIVQPPGRKLQNVTLLSGGEKALTAVALIFSIFMIKPTPFCLLDEVDAPLDDANIGRFNEMVREMSAISQFIIITHNKATMQVADTLYGITMEEPGASKVVSVRLH